MLEASCTEADPVGAARRGILPKTVFKEHVNPDSLPSRVSQARDVDFFQRAPLW